MSGFNGCVSCFEVSFFFQSGSSWKSSREKARVMFAPLSVYKAQSYSVSSLPTPKVALRILRRVRTHTFSTFKAVSAMVYFFCLHLPGLISVHPVWSKQPLQPQLQWSGSAQVSFKLESVWRFISACQMVKIEVEFGYKLDSSQKSITNYFWTFHFFSLFLSYF